MDLQLQEILYKKPNRQNINSPYGQQPNRENNSQTGHQFAPQNGRNNNPPFQGNRQGRQYNNFQDPSRANRTPFKQGYNQNQSNGSRNNLPQSNHYNQQQARSRSPNKTGQQHNFPNQQYKGRNPQFQQSVQNNEFNLSGRGKPYRQNNYTNEPANNQENGSRSQPRNNYRGRNQQYQQNMSQQDIMLNAMREYAAKQFHQHRGQDYHNRGRQSSQNRGGQSSQNKGRYSSQNREQNRTQNLGEQSYNRGNRGENRGDRGGHANPPRGGRGRGTRGRSPTRMTNQHQQPYQSDMDDYQNKQRMQKFKPMIFQKQPPFPLPKPQQKKPFIKKNDSPSSRQMSQELSEEQQSEQRSEQESGSYSQQQSQEQSQIQGQASAQDQLDSGQAELAEQNKLSDQRRQQYYKQSQIKASQIVSLKSIDNDVSTSAINEMCSKQEFTERLQTFQYNNKEVQHSKLKLDTSRSFSIFQINRRTLKPEYSLALKRFKRSADRAQGQDQPDTKDLRRSLKALVKVMNHINKEIIDADNIREKDLAFPTPPGEPCFEFIHVYDFLWDRMREMIKDITRLSQREKLTKQTIIISQQIARFFILSINQGRKKYNSRLKFSQRMNTESIIKVISNLMDFYRQSRMSLKNLIQNLSESERETITVQKIEAMMQDKGIYISPYQPELSAYSFLFSDNRKKQFYKVLTIGFEDQQTQSQNPLINSEQMQRALTVHRILNQKNIEQYFNKLEQNSTDYIFSCIMLRHIQRIRKDISQVLLKTHGYDRDGSISRNSMLAETLRKTLRFHKSQNAEFKDYLDMLGVQVSGKLLIWRQGELNQDHYLIPEYIFQNQKTIRKDQSDSQCKKHLKEPYKLSRQEIIKSSWKKSNYHKQVVSFYLGTGFTSQNSIGKVPILKQPTRTVRQISKQKQPQQLKQVEQPKDNSKQGVANLNTLNQMRKGLQKKLKRSKFLQKLEHQILQLYKHTDQAKIMNRKKSLAIIDEWMMYYHDKMLRISFDLIQNESRKKNLMVNIMREIKTFSGIKKKFEQKYNGSPYEFQTMNYQNIQPVRTQKGLMSGLLAKAHFKANKTTFDTFEQYLNESNHKMSNSSLNILILTTCGSSSHNDKILSDLILYFISQQKVDQALKQKSIKDVIKRISSKQKQVALIKVQFGSKNITVNLRIAKITDVKSKRKAIIQNLHVMKNLFGCNSLVILRENTKYHATQMVLQTFEEFVSNKSRIYQGDEEDEKYRIETLKAIQLPILLINVMKKSSNSQKVKSLVTESSEGTQRYKYMKFIKNISEVAVIEGSTGTKHVKLPFLMKSKLQKHSQCTQSYTKSINGTIRAVNRFMGQKMQTNSPLRWSSLTQNNANLCVRSLRQILRQIRVNSSFIQDKIVQGDLFYQTKKSFIFCFYQEYFNLCIDQIMNEVQNCYKNCLKFKKWPKSILLSQNILSQNELITNNGIGSTSKISQLEEEQLICNILDQQPDYNIVSETFKEHEFLKRICEQLKMKFVGQTIQPIQTEYLIFDQEGVNIFGMPRRSSKDQLPREEIQKTLHMTHFINVIAKYLNYFDQNKSSTDDKFQNVQACFEQYGLKFKMFNIKQLKNRISQSDNILALYYNYQIQGDSLEFFSYLLGYLMEGCKHINLILPINFKFKINNEDFFKASMKNLNNVILSQKIKKRGPFDSLKFSKNKELYRIGKYESRLQKDLQNTHDLNGSKTNKNQIHQDQNYQSQNLQRQQDIDPYFGDQQISPYDQQSNYSDESESQNQISKRTIKDLYRKSYPSFGTDTSFVYCRAQKLNELRKKVKI